MHLPPETLNPSPEAMDPSPSTLNPPPETSNLPPKATPSPPAAGQGEEGRAEDQPERGPDRRRAHPAGGGGGQVDRRSAAVSRPVAHGERLDAELRALDAAPHRHRGAGPGEDAKPNQLESLMINYDTNGTTWVIPNLSFTISRFRFSDHKRRIRGGARFAVS
eukprot:42057-Prorocentrum_minimum.AAC.1